MSMPRTSPRPESIRIRPRRVRIIVVLPAPLGPSRPMAPSGMSRLRPRRAWTLPYDFETSWSAKSIVGPAPRSLVESGPPPRRRAGRVEGAGRAGGAGGQVAPLEGVAVLLGEGDNLGL